MFTLLNVAVINIKLNLNFYVDSVSKQIIC